MHTLNSQNFRGIWVERLFSYTGKHLIGLELKKLQDSGPGLLKYLKDKGVISEAVGNKQQKTLDQLK